MYFTVFNMYNLYTRFLHIVACVDFMLSVVGYDEVCGSIKSVCL